MKVVTMQKSDCDKWVIAKHYSHRASIFWAGFGLEINGMIEGICVYGQPSPPIQKYAFIDRDFHLYELSRLVIQTEHKNAASFLVGNSLKLLKSPCSVVSYADMEHGHSGIIYQATNWIYTGATKSHDKSYIVDGKRIHPMSLRDKGITDPARWAKENNIQTVPPMLKHRYFQFTGTKRERKNMISKLKYPILKEYPKSPKTKYEDGQKIIMPTEQFLI
jgi:hypothetical protein